MGAAITGDPRPGAPVRGYPLSALEPARAAALTPLLTASPPGEVLAALLEGGHGVVLLSAHDVPPVLPPWLRAMVLGRGERRELVLSAPPGGLGALPQGARVLLGGRRRRALLAAHHPGLVAVASGPVSARIVPLWPDPTREPEGEVLEPESWLPEAGEGIPVLVAPASAELWDQPGLTEDPGARAVVLGERRIAEAFPAAVCCIRGGSFGAGLRFKIVLFSGDGRRAIRIEAQGPPDGLDGLVERAVKELTRRGAGTLN